MLRRKIAAVESNKGGGGGLVITKDRETETKDGLRMIKGEKVKREEEEEGRRLALHVLKSIINTDGGGPASMCLSGLQSAAVLLQFCTVQLHPSLSWWQQHKIKGFVTQGRS